jgi:hypothetical protein
MILKVFIESGLISYHEELEHEPDLMTRVEIIMGTVIDKFQSGNIGTVFLFK